MSITIDIPAKIDIDIYKGDDFIKAFWVTDADDGIIPLTGFTIEAELLKTNSDAGVLIDTFSTEIVEAEGKFTISLADDKTKDYDVSNGFFAVRLIDASGIKSVYALGEAVIHEVPIRQA